MTKQDKNLYGFARGITAEGETVYGIMVHARKGEELELFISKIDIEEGDNPTLIRVESAYPRIGTDRKDNDIYMMDKIMYSPDFLRRKITAFLGEWHWETKDKKTGFYNDKYNIWLDECELIEGDQKDD